MSVEPRTSFPFPAVAVCGSTEEMLPPGEIRPSAVYAEHDVLVENKKWDQYAVNQWEVVLVAVAQGDCDAAPQRDCVQGSVRHRGKVDRHTDHSQQPVRNKAGGLRKYIC